MNNKKSSLKKSTKSDKCSAPTQQLVIIPAYDD